MRRVRTYLRGVKAVRHTALGSSLSVHQRFDGALEVSNFWLARVAETRSFVIVIVAEHRCCTRAAQNLVHALNALC